jgi:uncharacterized protein involved in response to NO
MTDARVAIPRYRKWSGPALFSRGFRPFFLAAALAAFAFVPLWLAVFQGLLVVPSAFAPLTWHAHEMLFGFVLAAVAGFLMTAIPNWTGRMPLQGPALAVLVLLWLVGRLAVACGGEIGAPAAAILDLAFPLTLFFVVCREVVAGRNWRNGPMVVIPLVMTLANALMHTEALGLAPTATAGWRLGVGLMVVLIGLVGGRIVPSFTRNWLAKRGETRLPARLGPVDKLAIGLTVLWALVWSFVPDPLPGAICAGIAGLAQLTRLGRWRGQRTAAEPLLGILHLAYLWVPVGLFLLAAAPWAPAIPETAGVHALTSGAMASMILAVMTRATLGHTGRPLTAGLGTTLLYLSILSAGLARVAAALLPGLFFGLVGMAAMFWLFAFGLFLAIYGPMLMARAPN